MSHPSRPRAQGAEARRRRQVKIEVVEALEERCLLAPVLSTSPRLAAFNASTANTSAGGVTVTLNEPDTGFLTSAPLDTVTELAPISNFGSDIVTIAAGPGGVFGDGVYAISRGAGANGSADNTSGTLPALGSVGNAVNRPGVIYRVDPTTGATSVFFDLNTVIPQLDPSTKSSSTPAANGAGTANGLTNWYSITFDPEGYFDGKPSMLVASVDPLDPAKNAIYQISPSGTFMGVFLDFSAGAPGNLTVEPSSILVPPVQDQNILRGLLVSGGANATNDTFTGLFFNANAFTGGANITNTTALPTGVTTTDLGTPVEDRSGSSSDIQTYPIVGMTASNIDYPSPVYSIFTNFGTPSGGGISANPGDSGVQGLNGSLLIGSDQYVANANGGTSLGSTPAAINEFSANDSTDSTLEDRIGAVSSEFRQFQSIAFDQYGYFDQGVNLNTAGTTGGANSTTGSAAGDEAGGGSGSGEGTAGAAGEAGYIYVNPNTNTLTATPPLPAISLPPANAGNLFVADLGTGLSVSVPVPNPVGTEQTTIRVPVNGPENITVTNTNGVPSYTVTPVGTQLGGRIVRITALGVVSNFAENFDTVNTLGSNGFAESSLSISFSADGTTLYAADDAGIWQFKTVASLAGSTSGSLIGLNDLRSLGVPYDGEGEAVAVIDTGVDALNPDFRGRVATGTNVITNGFGNQDTAPQSITSANGTTTGGTNGGTTGGNGSNTATNPAPIPGADGHGTPVAGVVAQFVPQATIVPVDIFAPFLIGTSVTTTTTGGTGGKTGGNTGTNGNTTTLTANTNTLTTSQYLYDGLNYVAGHPYVNDPVRPGQVDRVVAAVMGFGSTTTFATERDAYKQFPQVTIALKDELKKFRNLGIAPVAASGQFGSPLGASESNNGTGTTGSGTGGGNTGTNNTNGTGVPGNPLAANNNFQNAAVGDDNGMSLPAVLNEVVSVAGSYSWPFTTGPGEEPTDPVTTTVGVNGRSTPSPLPVLVFGNATSLGGTATAGPTSSTNGGSSSSTSSSSTNSTTNNTFNSIPTILTAADFTQYTNRILGASNLSSTTDYVAPAVNVPTFRRTQPTNATTTTTTGNTATAGDPTDLNSFDDAGTSLSAAEVAGAMALVSSALDYWANLETTGVTSDAYLTMPVGVNTLNFGPNAFVNLTKYNNPDGINAILQWTAVPASDPNDGLSVSTPPTATNSTNPRNYSSLNVANAIAAIEGTVALDYLIAHNDFQYIDANKNGIITAQELQNFVNNSAKMGMPEAGAMAALLGGTARPADFQTYATSNPYGTNATLTTFGESPDQPDVEQRRFNFFDYAADGILNGSVTTTQYEFLAHVLLPSPTQFIINDRQAAATVPYLLAPAAQRDYHDLLYVKSTYEWVPKSALVKYQNISPDRFGVAKGLTPSASIFPVYTLYDGPSVIRTTVTTEHTAPATSASTATPAATATTTTATAATTTPTTATTTATTSATSTTTTTATPTSTTTTTPTTTTSSATDAAATLAQALQGIIANNSTTAATPVAASTTTTPSTTDTTTSSTSSNSSTLAILKKFIHF